MTPKIPLTDKRFQYDPAHKTDLAKKWDRQFPGWRGRRRAPGLVKEAPK